MKDYELKINQLLIDKNQRDALTEIRPTDQYVYMKSQQKLKADENSLNEVLSRLDYNDREIDRFSVEINKKYDGALENNECERINTLNDAGKNINYNNLSMN